MRMIICFGLFLIMGNALPGQHMNNQKLEKILNNHTDSLSGQEGSWKFYFEELLMICLTDEANNRMRIMTPVVDAEDLTSEAFQKCLEANFHTALDVKYALSDEVLWVVFIHPLKELSENQIIDALYQVYNATATFGSTFSSTHIIFPGNPKKVNKKPNLNIDKS